MSLPRPALINLVKQARREARAVMYRQRQVRGYRAGEGHAAELRHPPLSWVEAGIFSMWLPGV